MLDATRIHHRDSGTQIESLNLVVRDIDTGEADLAVDSPQMGPQLHPQQGVQVGQGFIQQHDLGSRRQSASQRDPLLLTAAQHGGVAVGQMAALHHVQHLT